MCNRHHLITSFALLVLFSGAPLTARTKVVSVREMLKDSEVGKDIDQRLLDARNKIGSELQVMQKELQDEGKALESAAKLADPEVLFAKRDKLVKKETQFKAAAEAAQGELNRKIDFEMGKYSEMMREELPGLAKTHSWEIVQLKETGELLYVAEEANVSKLVAAKIDAKAKDSKGGVHKASGHKRG
ncbi:MAG TPA: OmpH family outer membrane protein [Candidatus Babeliales bacterium]|nr:OmpH family outer membrane protein [Candidatus Babeliales bacterium]